MAKTKKEEFHTLAELIEHAGNDLKLVSEEETQRRLDLAASYGVSDVRGDIKSLCNLVNMMLALDECLTNADCGLDDEAEPAD